MLDLQEDNLAKQHIVMDHVRYRANGDLLMDIANLNFEPRGTTAIMGPNGAGKAFLLRIAHGLVEPSEGVLTINGSPMSPEHRLAQALVFQKPVLLRRSAAENISFVLRARRLEVSRVEALLDRVGLSDKAGAPARRLSGGEQQRLAMARALATNPAVLFLDEPTASLDPTSAKAIEDIIMDVVLEGVRVILVTHDAAQAKRLADDIVFLHRGVVKERGAAQGFLSGPKTELASAYLAGKLDELVDR